VAKFQTRETLSNEKKLKPGVIRYPGGCFADQYDWRDGVGPRDKRKYESNHFGTDEFVSFCKMVGAEPYLAANVRSRDVRVLSVSAGVSHASLTHLELSDYKTNMRQTIRCYYRVSTSAGRYLSF